LTGKGCVKVIVTELAVFDIGAQGMVLREVFPGVEVEHLRSVTEAEFDISPTLIEMNFAHDIECTTQ
jgi:acyl CoA:acetate/3-ketoacid CoA transferase beta subunit